jgi:hypothetical protein
MTTAPDFSARREKRRRGTDRPSLDDSSGEDRGIRKPGEI